MVRLLRSDKFTDVVIVGGGPAGLACAIELQREGVSTVVLEKGCVAQTLIEFPTYMRFFTSADGLELGGLKMACRDERPGRTEAIGYYQRLVTVLGLHVQQYERAIDIVRDGSGFAVMTTRGRMHASKVILATGFFDHPVLLGVPGEDLPKVMHYYREPHAYFDQNVLVIGGRNSAGAAAIELQRAGAHVTMVHRQPEFSSSMKPWLREELKSLVDTRQVKIHFGSQVRHISAMFVSLETPAGAWRIQNDFVFALTGYEPDMNFLSRCGIRLDAGGRPILDKYSLESSTTAGVYLAGVIVSGKRTNELNISHARDHARKIAAHLVSELRTWVA